MLAKLRLCSGLILFFFITTHLLNHALGLHSLAWMEAGLAVFKPVWRSWPGTILLYGAMLVHVVLAFNTLWRRASLIMPWSDAIQICLGLLIPTMIAAHIVATRVADAFYGMSVDYAYELFGLWVNAPLLGLQQVVVGLLIWVHGVIGLRNWLHLKRWYGTAAPWLFAAAILVPVMGILGFITGGREISILAQQDGWVAAMAERTGFLPVEAELVPMIYGAQPVATTILVVLLLALLAARSLRGVIKRKRQPIRITYGDKKVVSVERGITVLEASHRAHIPHAAVCGGRGRCSTCRVRVRQHDGALPTPSPDEARVLRRIGAPEDVRLACQLRPQANLEVVPLLAPSSAGERILSSHLPRGGEEREVAILFADLRGFTSLSEEQLPYDTVFILNRYFAAMGAAIEDAGGHVDKFIGDGVMAIFGLRSDVKTASLQSLKAAASMGRALVELNQTLAGDLPKPLRMGIGIHAGAAVVGEMGYRSTLSVTAIGDVVNTASRLEAATKEFQAELVVSERVLDLEEMPDGSINRHEIEIRGRRNKLTIMAFDAAVDVESFIS
ncbi:MAG: adenylate/guanylate cyclase domain-containing protein [Alphaproteobacteria bacterium]|nr:adenylate/guanylate cyclase domain-containing protein [Rhodospirillaceae bacterium]MBT6203531.1 adenylate/guanylate cyclase domain-containing protein [Rhodospirillaceae bacterium]MBT7615277.1 adenylate/guanylate cyclase domain-containing protein [Rhodospirillaceae bacterium]MDG2482046.1 adenylate/guanylate cyclase domain-containing protein [Alphaproteobacteria bacterium]